jgi:hypothetical protein
LLLGLTLLLRETHFTQFDTSAAADLPPASMANVSPASGCGMWLFAANMGFATQLSVARLQPEPVAIMQRRGTMRYGVSTAPATLVSILIIKRIELR